MKKLVLGLIIILAATAGMAQNKTLVAVIENSKASFTQTETTSTTKFQLNAAYTQIQDLLDKAAQVPTMKLTAVAKNNTLYDLVLVTTEQNQAEYVHKMFLTLGIEKISVDGKESKLENLPEILANLK
ncbi:MAG TPA: hypothetical protein VD905_16380 [Flavobacteriales bacterium]|nr:hypothetical protein [Flavobacteriales bacterium]